MIINLAGERFFKNGQIKLKKFYSRIKPINLPIKGIKSSKEIGIKSFISASALEFIKVIEKYYSEDEIDDPRNFIQKIVCDWKHIFLIPQF